ncbi:glycosyl transferase family 1 [Helicobacter cinaedi]|uniref:glycosyltransferase n=1 Tax=Helicobacter cinaedi TaxID=213 RepID=UPI001F37B099|nr:glycosyltransferase [Helicobacter cinaedi]BDB66145.1 glycosyl transferase family 1 [Helicobacter cinaedi]
MLPKILQLGKFYPPDIGGIENVMQDICIGINARGLVCDVLCSNSSYAFSYEIVGSARIYRTKSFGKLASTSITPQMIFTLQKLIKAYDIIHLHLPDPMANLALFLSNTQDKIIIVHWHSDIIKQKYLLKLYVPLQNWLLQRADYIIGTSPKYIAESPFLQPYRDKCVSIPIGIDDIAPSPLESTLPQHPAQSKKGEKKVIFALGRLVAYKGFEYAIEAMTLLPQYCLHIGGTGELQHKLQQKINTLGLQDRVKLIGTLSHQERTQQFRNAHIFILPSITKNEAFGIVQIEAMSQGLPVVSCSIDGSGVDYVNAHNVSGLVVPPRDPVAIAEAVIAIDRDYERFSHNARARFIEYFTIDTMLDSIYTLYTQHMATNGGGGEPTKTSASLENPANPKTNRKPTTQHTT